MEVLCIHHLLGIHLLFTNQHFYFSLKNDAYTVNFPNKYFFSESLYAGLLPLWNPYLNFGFPIYADPGFSFWNPITWLFGLIGYNAYTFTIEVLTYICIGAIGMYLLIKEEGKDRLNALIISIAFASSGFFIGNLQHINFITCIAFLPFCFLYWKKFVTTGKEPNFFTDVSMRNAYFGILLFFIAVINVVKISRNKLWLLFPLFGFIILSFGGNLKSIIYPHLPLLNFIRINGEYRIFIIFILLIFASDGLDFSSILLLSHLQL